MELVIKDLNVKVLDKEILKDFNLNIKSGEIHAIMGPNGTGKSTLSKVIMGDKNYIITKGSIFYDNKDLSELETYERSRLGIFLVYQNPVSIDGITNSEFIRCAKNEITGKNTPIYQFIKEMESNIDSLHMNSSMMHRNLNKGFSGGEMKKNEILQMLILKPKMIILDELDSGLDVDSLKVVCDNIVNYVKDNPDVSILLITHYTRIMEYIKPSFVHVLKDGSIVKEGDYSLAKYIENNGYNGSFNLEEENCYE